MLKKAANALGVTLTLFLSLYLWRDLYPVTNWAVLALTPLAALLFIGSLQSSAAVYRASIRVAVREDSSLAWLLTGRLRALLGATTFTLIAVPLLAWHALSSTYPEFLLLILLCFSASLSFVMAEDRLFYMLTPPFARAIALSTATLIAAIVFIPILAWANWNFTPQPGAICTMDLEEALKFGISQLPARRGWVAEILTPLFALEYGKLWLVVQPRAPNWFLVLYCIDAAFISLVAARVSAVLMSLVQITKGRSDNANLTSC